MVVTLFSVVPLSAFAAGGDTATLLASYPGVYNTKEGVSLGLYNGSDGLTFNLPSEIKKPLITKSVTAKSVKFSKGVGTTVTTLDDKTLKFLYNGIVKFLICYVLDMV